MTENSTMLGDSGLERTHASVAENVSVAIGLTAATSQAPADPIAPAGMVQHSLVPAAASPEVSGSTDPVASSIDPHTGEVAKIAAKPVVKVKGIEEIVRTDQRDITSWQPPFEVEEGSEGSFKEILERTEFVRDPLRATPLPTGSAKYGTTDELFTRLDNAIATQAALPAQTSALLAYWTFSTWFSDGLSLSPGLCIIGPPFEGDLVLRILRNYCRYPLMMTGVNTSDLKRVNWYTTPTLLFFAPDVSRAMISLIGCTTSRGYLVNDAGRYKDFYGPKAIYLGTDPSFERAPRCSIQVCVHPSSTTATTQSFSPPGVTTVQDLQNQLQRYRLKNLAKVYESSFDAPGLTSETRTVANALGACLADSHALQEKIVSLLTPVESQRQADRATSIEAITLEAALNLVHQNRAQILVNEISTEVNRIAQARGEKLHYSAEIIGHRLKKIGVITRRLGKAGRGLLIDASTAAQVHELGTVYGVGLDQDEKNLNCALCIPNK